MKTSVVFSLLASVLILFAFQQCKAQEPKPENWTSEQLMQPADLAQALNDNKNIPLIYCVGPGVVIPHSIDIGMTDKPENIQKLKDSLKKVSRDANIVIYCGCCPFARCPNVRPAIALLKEMKFTNYHLLNLPHNIRTDWISKGYPQVSE
ncbi:MAG: rhodanese-like domain-containing protein [Ginsengibacter sp.]